MKSDTVKSFVLFILLLQVVATALLWILNVLSANSTAAFSILLAANLVAFATVIQVYRNPGTVEPTKAVQVSPPPPPTPTPLPAATSPSSTPVPAAAIPVPASASAPASTSTTAPLIATTTPPPAAAPPPAHLASPNEVTRSEAPLSKSPIGSALPQIIHIGIPIASFVILFAFAIVLFQPADKSTLPVESTTLFIPVYLTIVVVLVFGSMYLFKRIMDTEEESGSY